GVLYVEYVDNPSLLNNVFRHHFARSFDRGATWTDQILQSMDSGLRDCRQPSSSPCFENAINTFIWHDYEGLTAFAQYFLRNFFRAIHRSAHSAARPHIFHRDGNSVAVSLDLHLHMFLMARSVNSGSL